MALGLLACHAGGSATTATTAAGNETVSPADTAVVVGAARTDVYVPLLRGKRLAPCARCDD